jgi:hypothetical protein
MKKILLILTALASLTMANNSALAKAHKTSVLTVEAERTLAIPAVGAVEGVFMALASAIGYVADEDPFGMKIIKTGLASGTLVRIPEGTTITVHLIAKVPNTELSFATITYDGNDYLIFVFSNSFQA